MPTDHLTQRFRGPFRRSMSVEFAAAIKDMKQRKIPFVVRDEDGTIATPESLEVWICVAHVKKGRSSAEKGIRTDPDTVVIRKASRRIDWTRIDFRAEPCNAKIARLLRTNPSAVSRARKTYAPETINPRGTANAHCE